MRRFLVALALVAAATIAFADNGGKANVTNVEVTQTGTDTYRFDVTIASKETGWDYYADAFEVVGPDGEVLGKRTLHHPHVDEQPFTRSLTGVAIDADIDEVTVRAHHNPEGYDGQTVTVTLPR